MKYPRILSKIVTTPWAIMPASFDGITKAINGAHADMSDDVGDVPDPSWTGLAPGVAVIPVSGIIGKHLSMIEAMCGGCSIEAVQAQFDAAIADSSTTDIVFCFDSPGGTVPGVPELAQRIREKADASGKRIYAFTDSLMASAAYWLASSADYIVCTPTATVGSIGVYCAFQDNSAAYDKAGVKIDLIKAGKYKDLGSDARPMTDEERAMVQSNVDEIYGMFTGAVSAARPDVTSATMQGQTFMGQSAVKAGLVDDMCQDFDEFLSGIQQARGLTT